jgi:signal transduction histidine kinase
MAAVAAPLAIAAGSIPLRSNFGLAGGLFCTLLVVVAVARIGGVPPAVGAVAVGVVAGAFFLAPPFNSLRLNRAGDIVALVVFALVGVIAALLIDELVRVAEEQAESRVEIAASRARIVAAADETRRQIERDLHDGAQQRLVSLGLGVRAAQAAVPPGLGDLEGELSRVAEGLASVQDELREFARGIHPAILAEGGLEAALKTLARRSAVPVKLDMRSDVRPTERVEVAAYYVVSEALANAAKYAHASVVHVEVEPVDRFLRVDVTDDGVGGADPARGSGLVGLKDRVEALGGTITIKSPPGEGTFMCVQLPLEE